MPTRLIREGWKDSERINGLSAPAEVFFLRLCLAADDFNRYTAHPKVLASMLFPLKDVSDQEILAWLGELMMAGMVGVYEVNGTTRDVPVSELGDMNRARTYVYIARFRQRTRAERSKYPAPPDETVRRLEPNEVLVGHMTGMCRAEARPPRTEAEAEAKSETEAKPKGGRRGAPRVFLSEMKIQRDAMERERERLGRKYRFDLDGRAEKHPKEYASYVRMKKRMEELDRQMVEW